MFTDKDQWPMREHASPLDGWPLTEHYGKWGNAKNDIYGSFYFYVRERLIKFCKRIHSGSKLQFAITQSDARELPVLAPKIFKSPRKIAQFDRIECANIADEAWLEIEPTLTTFSTMLKAPTENKHATLITFFRNAVRMLEELHSSETVARDGDALDSYLGPPSSFPNRYSAEMMRFIYARPYVRDYDKVFDQYTKIKGFANAAKKAGLRMKPVHTIVEKWPSKLKLKANEPGGKEEFEIMMASGHDSRDRYVEWTRLEDISV